MEGQDLGLTLRQARETRGLTVDALAQRTRIAPKFLTAIERNALNELPGGLFARGYLRAYAGEVGLDTEQVVREFLAELPVASDEDLLDKLRARHPPGNSRRRHLLQFVVVLASLTCLLYLLSRPSSPEVTRDIIDDGLQSPGLSLGLDRQPRVLEAA